MAVARRTYTDEVGLLSASSAVFKDAMTKFRDFHDICRCTDVTEVKVITAETFTKIEQCAVDFRYTCNQTATIVERISNGWIEDCIVFFEDLEAITPEDAKAIATEATQNSGRFSVIHGWVVSMAGNLHEYYKAVEQETGVVLLEAEKALEEAKSINRAAEIARKEAETKAKEAEGSQYSWGVAAFIPAVNIIALPMYISCRDKTDKATESKRTTLVSVENAVREQSEAEEQQEKIKIIVEKIAELARCLVQIEGICEGQVEFWKEQGDKFGTFASRMTGSKRILEKKAAGQLDWLTERKEQLDKYYKEMQDVTRGGHFNTTLTPTFRSQGDKSCVNMFAAEV